MKQRGQHSKPTTVQGFTLIELLVVVAIIALLTSIVMVGLYTTRAKARDTRRAGDMTQIIKGIELFNATNRGYPAATNGGQPANLVPTYAAALPVSPTPPDGSCDSLTYPNGQPASGGYYYVASGTVSTVNGLQVYPDFLYYFCLGSKVGDITPGVHYLSPRGVR